MQDPFWTHDTSLFEGTFRYFRGKKQPVRGKVHVREERYDFSYLDSLDRGYLTEPQGKRIYVLMHPYVAVPNDIMSVGLYPKPKQYADTDEAIGEVTRSLVAGFRDVQTGGAQAWYYQPDKVLVLWECYLDGRFLDVPLGKDTNMSQLWTGFEQWLLDRYPETERITTPFADPIWDTKEYQSFLRRHEYMRGKPGTFTKLVK